MVRQDSGAAAEQSQGDTSRSRQTTRQSSSFSCAGSPSHLCKAPLSFPPFTIPPKSKPTGPPSPLERLPPPGPLKKEKDACEDQADEATEGAVWEASSHCAQGASGPSDIMAPEANVLVETRGTLVCAPAPSPLGRLLLVWLPALSCGDGCPCVNDNHLPA